MRRSTLRAIGTGLVALGVTAPLLAGCSSAEPQAEGPVTISYVSWALGMEEIVDLWNSENPDIQVELIKPAGTGYELYNKLITDNRAGTNPDVIQLEYQAIPALVANGVVIPLDEYVSDLDTKYTDTTLSQVQFDGQTWGLPNNICPLVFFYREDLFDELGLSVPTTWDEYAEVAAAVRAADPNRYLGNFSAADPAKFSGLSAQAGADWWRIDGDAWTVDIDSEATTRVADYWQGLVDAGTISPAPSWSAQWNTEMNDGTLLSWISGSWGPNQFPAFAADSQGKWRAAPLPVWEAGDATTGAWGGESEAVTANSEHPAEAAKFVEWMNATVEGQEAYIKWIGIYPALTEAQSSPLLDEPPAFMSNQPDYNQLVTSAVEDMQTFSVWGPNSNVTYSEYENAFASALQNGTPLSAAVESMQRATVDDMVTRGFTLSE